MVFLILILVLVGVVIWLFLPGGDRIDMDAVVSTNAVAMVHLTDCAEDPGMIALIETLSETLREVQRANLSQELPENLRGLSDLAMISGGNWRPSYLPEVVLTADNLTPSQEVFVVAAALDGLPKVFTLPLRIAIENSSASRSVTRHREQDLLYQTDGVLTFFGPTVVYASDLDAMRGTVDRVLDGAPPTPLRELIPPAYPDQWDVYGILQNRDDALATLVRELEDTGSKIFLSIATELIEDAWFGIDVMSGERIRAELVLSCVDDASARTVMEFVRGSLAEAVAEIDDKMVDVTLQGECRESQAIISVDIMGLTRLIEYEMREAMQGP